MTNSPNLEDITTKIAELDAKNGFKGERINQIIKDQRRMEEKIDTIADNVNKLMLQSVKDDNTLNQRLTAIETEIAVQKQANLDNHNRLSSLLALVGVGLTIITIIINVYFNIIT